jgi:hypothetical protein
MKQQLTTDERNELEQAHRYSPGSQACHAAVMAIDELRAALDDAVALLRDWEDYDSDDPECSWQKRRDEFLAEHEKEGR